MGPSSLQQDSNYILALNNIHVKHLKSSPYHPATNGLVECLVQTSTQALKEMDTEATPATLMMGRDLQCRLSLLKPDLRESVF